MNAAMEPIFRAVAEDGRECVLPRALEERIRAGLVRSGGRLRLVRPEHSTPPPGHLDDLGAELWVNKLHLDTETPASDPAWRAELLRHGLTVARRLLPQAVTLSSLPARVLISLQSAPGTIDPTSDFATGAVHLFLVRSAHEDVAAWVEDVEEPVLALTTTAR
ncbi:hypothetical protein [Cellulomonas sp. SLBN-39]|uniref:hypothetical protein n=1 Tax=Cellulomonas sp. SLBN-39 TaxID=2768446 RepID=UPI001153C4BE|nr:hypothetical protein [Cellulomonas sp. SLBN-39]